MKGIVIGGTASGTGKTIATLAVSFAVKEAGYEPVPAKAGPDYIDPSHHAVVLDRPSRTLDTWMQGVDGVRRTLYRAADDAGTDRSECLAVVEGMMGLYDGTATSTAATAAALDVPVVLVVDARAGMESVGATALGFREYASQAALPESVAGDLDDPAIDVVGVVASRAHGGRHAEGIRKSLPEEIEWLGRVPPIDDLEIPDRHLGLHMGEESPVPDAAVAEAAASVDGDAIGRLARSVARPGSESTASGTVTGSTASGTVTESTAATPTVAVALDDAFRFIYPATRERLRELATVVTFSPMAGDELPDCDAAYLPGGYPENHPERISDSSALSGLATRAADGLPILGECGGLMALSESLTTVDGDAYAMAGVLPGHVEMHDRYQALDHVELRAVDDGVTASAGERHRGHEFHYSSHTVGSSTDVGSSADVGSSMDGTVDTETDARFAFEVDRGDGIDGSHDGLRVHRTVGTYAHRHAASGAFDRLVEAAREYATGR
ncbi:cobyrinic acid a,c-diamide synthase [Halorubrum luteum]